MVGVAYPVGHRAIGANERRLPGTARTHSDGLNALVGVGEGVELPQQRAVGRVERQQNAPSGPRAILAREIDTPVSHLGLDPEGALALLEEFLVDPNSLTGSRVEREGRGWCLTIDRADGDGDGDTVRSRSTHLGLVHHVLPQESTSRQRERVDVATKVLHVDDAVGHDRIGCERADAPVGLRCLPLQCEGPEHPHLGYVRQRDRRSARVTRVRQVAIGIGP